MTIHRCVLLIAVLGNPVCLVGDEFRVEHDQGRVTVREGEQIVLRYQQRPLDWQGQFARAHYVHPLFDLDGQCITEDFPADHRHHRGIFWAWHQVRVGRVRAGDAWLCRDFDWQVDVSAIAVNPRSASIQATALWKSPDVTDAEGTALPLVEDRLRLTVHPAQGRCRWIDFDIQLLALQPEVHIGGSEDAKGYGGFSPRVKLHSGQTFYGRAGPVQPQQTAVTAGPWIALADQRGGLAILAHPDNPQPKDRWILRGGGQHAKCRLSR